jgi:hypothetical protein
MWGASPPTFLRAFPGPGAGQTSKNTPTDPARLPLGTQLPATGRACPTARTF